MSDPELLDGDERLVGGEPETVARVLGYSERGRAVSGFIVALQRAARSYLLYDPSNEAIRHFLQAVQLTSQACFSTGDVDLKIRPFELVLGSEVVYSDNDRERSLAFRLYRDGVRRLLFQADTEWDEVLKFLSVISVRYTGIRQAEDDMVVLLWKAGFVHIQVEAVEGVVEDDGIDVAQAAPSVGHYAAVPDDFDLPGPELPEGVEVFHQPVPDAILERVRHEDESSALPEVCVQLADEVINACLRPYEPLPFEDAIPILRELRDFLLAEGTLEPLLAVLRCVASAPLREQEDLVRRDELASSFLEMRALKKLLRTVTRDQLTASPELIDVIESVPGDRLPALLNVVEEERADLAQHGALLLVKHYVPARVDWMIAQLPQMADFTAGEVLTAIADTMPARALDAVTAVAGRDSEEIQINAVKALERVALGPGLIKALTGSLHSPNESVRRWTMEMMARRQLRGCYPAVLEHVKRAAAGLRLPDEEADCAGETLAKLEPVKALDTFREWCTPPKFYQFVPPGRPAQLRCAVSGLVFIPGEEAEKLIRLSEKQGGEALHRHCVAAMVKRRRLTRGAS